MLPSSAISTGFARYIPERGILLGSIQPVGIRFAPVDSASGGSEDSGPDLGRVWSNWKKKFLVPLAKGTLVQDPNKHSALSEGSSYGLMIGLSLALSSDDQKTFDQILNGLENYAKKANGLYAWNLSLSGQVLSSPSATDADVNVAYCLMQADEMVKSGKWKPPVGKSADYYKKRAQELVAKIWDSEVITRGGKLILKPSDDRWPEWGDGRFVFNPSYFVPHQLAAIAKLDTNPAHNWKQLITDGYELMDQVLNSSAVLKPKGQNPIPDNVLVAVVNGTFRCESYNKITPDNEFDAIRVLTEMARAALLDHDPKAIAFLKKLLTKAGADGFWTVKVGGYNNELAIALYGVGVKGAGDPAGRLDGYLSQLMKTKHGDYFGYSPNDANDYYKQSLILLAATLLFKK